MSVTSCSPSLVTVDVGVVLGRGSVIVVGLRLGLVGIGLRLGLRPATSLATSARASSRLQEYDTDGIVVTAVVATEPAATGEVAQCERTHSDHSYGLGTCLH